MFLRKCPCCSKDVIHPNVLALKQAIKRNRPCKSCSSKSENTKKKVFPKMCEVCKHTTFFTSLNAIMKCKSCVVRKIHKDAPLRMSGENNPMFGKSAISIWQQNLSPEESESKINNLRRLRSKNVSGENNPMFGKPSPINSGNGISGRYKGTHFRSLLELAFLEKFEQQNNKLPQSAETNEYKVVLNNGRNYFPDFVDDGIIYEIKPSKLLTTEENVKKIQSAKFQYGNKFVVVTELDLENYKSIQKRLQSFDQLVLNKRSYRS